MKIVLDANILLSALIKDSVTREIILTSHFNFYFPEPTLHALRKYEHYVIEKAGYAKSEYDLHYSTLFKYISIISIEKIYPNYAKAVDIMGHIDKEDVVIIAAALSLPNSLIWTNDLDFQLQAEIKILRTIDVVKLLPSLTKL